MSDLSTMIERNKVFAAKYEGGLSLKPNFSTIVLTCTDARIDPAHFLGLELGDALVMRNAGGRITEAIELELGFLWVLASKMMGDRAKLSLAIIHHTDCGVERLANPELRQLMSQKLDVDIARFEAMAIIDHQQSLNDDVERLRKSSLVPNDMIVSAHLYDVTHGTMTEMIAPAKLAQKTTI
jgi:carbonic anhydrase